VHAQPALGVPPRDGALPEAFVVLVALGRCLVGSVRCAVRRNQGREAHGRRDGFRLCVFRCRHAGHEGATALHEGKTVSGQRRARVQRDVAGMRGHCAYQRARRAGAAVGRAVRFRAVVVVSMRRTLYGQFTAAPVASGRRVCCWHVGGAGGGGARVTAVQLVRTTVLRMLMLLRLLLLLCRDGIERSLDLRKEAVEARDVKALVGVQEACEIEVFAPRGGYALACGRKTQHCSRVAARLLDLPRGRFDTAHSCLVRLSVWKKTTCIGGHVLCGKCRF